jgi:hypothetical protein
MRTGDGEPILVSALTVRTNFGKLLRTVGQRRSSFLLFVASCVSKQFVSPVNATPLIACNRYRLQRNLPGSGFTVLSFRVATMHPGK